MSEPFPRPDLDRRHPRLPYEELRRQLLDADLDRYRLQNELRASGRALHAGSSAWSIVRRRAALGAGIVIVTSLAGGLAWQMCTSTARADDHSSVRVETTTVAAKMVSREPPRSQPAAMKAAAKLPAVRRAKAVPVRNDTLVGGRRARPVPRPLSPGEFGRTRLTGNP
jgi:hypothetical protein